MCDLPGSTIFFDNISQVRDFRKNFIEHIAHLRLETCDFSGETFKGFEVLSISMSAKTTQLLSSGEFCKLRHDTIPVKSVSAKCFYTSNSKMPNFEFRYSCHK